MNEEKTIEIEGNFEFKDFLRNMFWQTFKKTWMFVLLIFILIYFWIFIVSSQKSTLPVPHPQEFAFIKLLPFFMPFFILMFMLINIYSSSRKIFNTVKGTIKWSFSDFGFETVAPMGSNRIKWEGLQEIKETSKDFLIYQQKPRFIIIPKRFFESEAQIVEFRELVRSQLGKKAKLKLPIQRLGLK